MLIRTANRRDMERMSRVLQEIAAASASDHFKTPQQVLDHYIEHPDRIQCSIAEAGDGQILGFQSLKRATAGNPYDVPIGWGIIGTHVSPRAKRSGVGAALFAETLGAARRVRLSRIDATIGANNTAGLAYYEAMGFKAYRTMPGIVCKCYRLDEAWNRVDGDC